MKLKPNNPALIERRTVNIRFSNFSEGTPLKSVEHNGKVGKGKKIIRMSRWKGMPMFSLTLEERQTCPSSCFHWDDCYGNTMFYANRQSVKDITLRIFNQLVELEKKYPKGFVIRLHILGDFFSYEYVKFWEECLETFPMLTVFGYSARIGKDNDEDIFEALKDLRYKYLDRWFVRFSTNKTGRGKLIYAADENFKGKGFGCPEMTGMTESCLTCMACLTTKKTVIFPTH